MSKVHAKGDSAWTQARFPTASSAITILGVAILFGFSDKGATHPVLLTGGLLTMVTGFNLMVWDPNLLDGENASARRSLYGCRVLAAPPLAAAIYLFARILFDVYS